jgi:hypothetical protein
MAIQKSDYIAWVASNNVIPDPKKENSTENFSIDFTKEDMLAKVFSEEASCF